MYFTEKTDIKQGLRFWLRIGSFAAKERFDPGGHCGYDAAGKSRAADTTGATATGSGHLGDWCQFAGFLNSQQASPGGEHIETPRSSYLAASFACWLCLAALGLRFDYRQGLWHPTGGKVWCTGQEAFFAHKFNYTNRVLVAFR
jgi:hypothetical protein